MSCKNVCSLFYISPKTFYNWRKDYRILLNENNGAVDPSNPNKGPTKRTPKKPKYNDELMTFVKTYTINRDNFRIKNLIKEIKKKYNEILTSYNIYYILKKQGVTYKKAKHRIIKKPDDHKQKVEKLINDVNIIGTNNIISMFISWL